LDADAEVFRLRDLSDSAFPYVFLDATYCKARVVRRVVSQAVVVAFGVRSDGHREILGLHGVHPVVSDAHKGLRATVQAVLQGSTWQRCRVHFLRNAPATLPQGRQEMIASLIRTIFSQPEDPEFG
jgi:transposase-like protein